MSKPFQKTDIRVTRFRLPHEDLRDSGSGCLIYHIPSQKSYVVEKAQPFYVNKGEALDQLCAALGITREAIDQQADNKAFPNWETTELHTRRYGKYTLTVYFLQGEEDPDMTGWTWGVDDDRLDIEADAGLYETPEGAIKAAEKWALFLVEEASEDDTEGERSSSSTETDTPS